MSSKQYCEILSGIVALPSICECSLNDFAKRLRTTIKSELRNIHPDNALISLLCDAARIGYEYGECAQKSIKLPQQQLTQQEEGCNSAALAVCKKLLEVWDRAGPLGSNQFEKFDVVIRESRKVVDESVLPAGNIS